MIHTSYYAKYKGNSGVCISRTYPKGFKGETCTALYPPKKLLEFYKAEEAKFDGIVKQHGVEAMIAYRNKIERIYADYYKEAVLNKIDLKNLGAKLQGKVLLCWEKSGRFCHRYLVAEALEKAGFKCSEL